MYVSIVGTSIDVNNWIWYIVSIVVRAWCSKLTEKGALSGEVFPLKN